LGIVLPLLPTTPFLLLASYLFVRSSKKLNSYLLNHPLLGFYIKSYLEKKGIPLKLKIFNLVLLWGLILYSVFCVLANLYLQVLLIIIALSVSTHILMLKTLK